MANKKLQNNQNRRNTEGPTMNGNSSTSAAGPVQSASQNLQNTNAGSSNANQNNNTHSANTNGTANPSSASSTTNSVNTSYNQHHQSQNQHSHQRHSSTSSSSQQTSISKQPVKKHNEVEKIILQINNSVGSTSNQGGYRSGGNKDQKGREKDKEKNQGRQGNQANHYHHQNHNNGGGGGGNQQNNRKKDNKFQNRDPSNNSHRGGYSNNYGSHHQQQQLSSSLENTKSSGFPSNTSLSSAGIVSASPTPVPPAIIPVFLESKTVQTEEKPKKQKHVKKEEESDQFKKTNPKDMDTVMAFKEHDDWNKIELMCELIYLLSPTDLRLLLNCINGSIRCYANQMKPVENTSNCSEPTAGLPPSICFPPVQSQTCFTNAHEPNQRVNVQNIFCQQFPPGLQPLIAPGPNVVYPTDSNYNNHPPSSVTPSSSSSTNTKETVNGTTSVSNPTAVNSISSDGQQQESSKHPPTVAGAPVNADQTSATITPETDTTSNATINPIPSSSTSTQQSLPPVPQEPEKFLQCVRDLTSYMYTLMSVCGYLNRKSAAKISDYFKNVILREKAEILKRIPDELDQIDVLQDIGKTIAAMTHHPAISLDDKMYYADMRDGLRAEIESLFRQYYSPERENERKQQSVISNSVGDVDEAEDSDDYSEEENYESSRFGHVQTSSKSVPGTFFITRFIGRQVERNDNLFSLEIHWSDGDRTFAQRTRDQLKALQHRLLDEFGQQRSEKYNHHPGTASSYSSFDEDSKKLSASTSTMETSFAPSGDRIVPRLARDATAAQYIQYINELSDLPARMMLSSVICEEFNGTRSRSDDLLQQSRDLSDGLIFSRWKNPRAKTSVRYFKGNTTGSIEQVELPANLLPFLYSNIPQSQIQVLMPSCANCGGPHNTKQCDKPTLLNKKALVEQKNRNDTEGLANVQPTSQHGGTSSSSSNSYATVHAPVPFFFEPQGLVPPSQFTHQQMMQSAMYHNGQYRPNSQYDNSIPAPVVFYHYPNSNPAAMNNGNSGGVSNPNNNF